MGKLTFKSNFALWSSFQVKFERVVNGLGGQKSSQMSSKHGLMGSSAKTGKLVPMESQEQKRCTFLGSKHKSVIWNGTAPACTSNLVYMCAEGFRGHKSSNRIQLSRFIHIL